MSEIITEKSFFMRSKTNDGEFAKQYFSVCYSDKYEKTLVINKLVLTSDLNEFYGYIILKEYKGKYLIFKSFGIKLSTLKTVNEKIWEQ